MAENGSLKDRLYQYLEAKRIAPSNFEKTIGAGGSYLKNVKTLGGDKLLAISEYYTDLSLEWLITGEGKMLKNITSEVSEPRPYYSKSSDSSESISIREAWEVIKRQSEQLDEKDKMIKELIEELRSTNTRKK